MKDTYITATLQLLATGTEPELVFSNLKKVMDIRGESGLLGAVLGGLLKAYEQIEKNTTPTVIVATEKDATSSEVKNALELLGATKITPKIIIDDTIIGGAEVLFNHKLIDLSYKTQLHSLYKAALNA